MNINAVEFMYEQSCYKSSTSKYEQFHSNINISKISYLPFDVLCFHFNMMTMFQIHRQLTSALKRLVVQNCANGTRI